jgi:uncharacterized protein YndB with AHSA1/START domain
MRTDRAHRHIKATPKRIYRALTDRDEVQEWLPPEGAHGIIEAFEPKPGGAFRITLVFDAPEAAGTGKSSANTDVVTGVFLDLIPDKRVRQRFEFTSDDPKFAGAMDMTWALTPVADGTEVAILADNVPEGITPEDHQAGMTSSLANLARASNKSGHVLGDFLIVPSRQGSLYGRRAVLVAALGARQETALDQPPQVANQRHQADHHPPARAAAVVPTLDGQAETDPRHGDEQDQRHEPWPDTGIAQRTTVRCRPFRQRPQAVGGERSHNTQGHISAPETGPVQPAMGA